MNTLAFDSLLYFKDESQLDYQFLLLHLYSFLDACDNLYYELGSGKDEVT